MKKSTSLLLRFQKNIQYFFAILWILAIGTSLYWNWTLAGTSAVNYAKSEARAAFNKDLVYRRWASMLGGVYVVPNEHSPPNPYLSHLPNRDLVTEDGLHLTLINPAYMTRQVYELSKKQYGIQGHITSLKPLNPINEPDPWERQSLQQLNAATDEIVDIQLIDDSPYLRLLRPMITEESCLKCHAFQGYTVGDVRGAISVSVPFSPYLSAAQTQQKNMLFAHTAIALFGLFIIWLGNHLLARSNKRLLQNKTLYSRLLKTSMDGILIIDSEGHIIEVNQAYCRLTGFSKEEVLAKTIVELDATESPEQTASHLQHLFELGEDRFETQHYCKDRSIIVFEVKAQVAREENHIITFLRDITERIDKEKQLKESEERYRAFYNASFGGIVIHDRGTILECNRGLSAITGYTKEELIGMDGLLLIAPECRELVMNHILAGYEKEYETEGIRKNQERYPVRIAARNIPYLGRQVRCTEFRDITKYKEYEAEHDKLRYQLAQAQKMESIGRLAGGVAHDFNNMLSIILGRAEMITEAADKDSSIYHDAWEIHKAAERSTNLTRRLLAFARKETINPKILDLNDALADMLTMVRRLIGENIELRWTPGQDIWPVQIDPSQLDQAIANLCINARDAIGSTGTITIETANGELDEDYCRLHPGARPGEYAVLSISDDGCGMEENTLSMIFEPFFTTKEVGHGTGLGLAVVYGIVKQNRGFVTAYSEPGKGTTFTLFFPKSGHSSRKNETHASSLPATPRGNATVLLIEDEAALLQMTTAMLQRQGFTVIPVNDPSQALTSALAHDGTIDVILTDVIMPGMNGQQVVEQLSPHFPEARKLFMSGYPAQIIASQGILHQDVAFIKKPFTRKELSLKINEMLNREISRI